MNYSLRTIIGFCFLLVFVTPACAQPLPIGLTINTSGLNAQYALDFKNGIEAFITAENGKKRFGKYKLALIVMEDMGKTERIYANTKRLLKQKQVLALLTEHKLNASPKIVDLAAKYNTLLLTSDIKVDSYSLNKQENLGFLSSGISEILKPARQLLIEAQQIYLITDGSNHADNWYKVLSDSTANPVYKISREQLNLSANISKSLYVLDQNFIDAAPLVQNITTENPTSNILVLPQTGATLLGNAVNHQLTATQRQHIYYLNTVPLHKSELTLVKRFRQDMARFNPHASTSHQAFKGYLLASLAAESIYHSVKGLQADSILDVVTLPFQVLDQVVGWVKHAGSDISNAEVVETFNRMKNFDNGLHKAITINKDRVILGESWLTKMNDQDEFYEVSIKSRGFF